MEKSDIALCTLPSFFIFLMRKKHCVDPTKKLPFFTRKFSKSGHILAFAEHEGPHNILAPKTAFKDLNHVFAGERGPQLQKMSGTRLPRTGTPNIGDPNTTLDQVVFLRRVVIRNFVLGCENTVWQS